MTAAILSMIVTAGCDDTRTYSVEPVCRDENAAPVFLMSKADDDEGDGIILDEVFPAINDEDDDIADHARVKDDSGLYHLFFHTEGHGSGTFIEHYTTADLQSLDYVGPAILQITAPAHPGTAVYTSAMSPGQAGAEQPVRTISSAGTPSLSGTRRPGDGYCSPRRRSPIDPEPLPSPALLT